MHYLYILTLLQNAETHTWRHSSKTNAFTMAKIHPPSFGELWNGWTMKYETLSRPRSRITFSTRKSERCHQTKGASGPIIARGLITCLNGGSRPAGVTEVRGLHLNVLYSFFFSFSNSLISSTVIEESKPWETNSCNWFKSPLDGDISSNEFLKQVNRQELYLYKYWNNCIYKL